MTSNTNIGVRVALVATLALASTAACYVGPLEGQARESKATADASVDASPAQGSAGEGLPCDVDGLLQTSCRGCHMRNGTAPMPLVDYGDLSAPAPSNPAKNTATMVIERMRSTTSPMPPSSPLPSETIQIFERWVAAGMPRGECRASSPAAEDAVAMRCTSAQSWTRSRKDAAMWPGRACITCHESEEDKPVVWAGGTVYPTLHEPDDCYGAPGDGLLEVIITDHAGRVVRLPVGPTGNFSLEADKTAPLAMPIRAKVVRGSVERVMNTAPSTANCNACHTAQGANGAPGRILAP